MLSKISGTTDIRRFAQDKVNLANLKKEAEKAKTVKTENNISQQFNNYGQQPHDNASAWKFAMQQAIDKFEKSTKE